MTPAGLEAPLPSTTEHTLEALEGILPSLYQLSQHLDRELIAKEELVFADRIRNPVAHRLIESLFEPRGVTPTTGSTSAPHILVGEMGFRVNRLVDRRLYISTNTAANRVLRRGIQSAVTELTRALNRAHDDTSLDTRARRVRSFFIRLSERIDPEVGEMRPADLMDRSLRYAPKYKPVLLLHKLTRQLRHGE